MLPCSRPIGVGGLFAAPDWGRASVLERAGNEANDKAETNKIAQAMPARAHLCLFKKQSPLLVKQVRFPDTARSLLLD